MNPHKLKGRYGSLNQEKYREIGKEDSRRGIFGRENEKGNATISASSTYSGDVYTLLNSNSSSNFWTNNVPNSFITASLKDGKSFIVKSYMIKSANTSHRLQHWKLEGQKASDGQWVTLDSHQNDPTRQLQTRTFDVSCDEKLKAVKLTQTGKDTYGYNHLVINAFDVFGLLFE